MKKEHSAIGFAILAAALYALNAPLSKALLAHVPPTMMASLLYLGAGTGMLIMMLARKAMHLPSTEMSLTKKDLPYTMGMITLDILAPIFLMIGLTRTTASHASLLNNFEIVATSIIALILFRERVSLKLWCAIGLITFSSVLLSLEDAQSFRFSIGSLFVLLACCCWGLENNCTRMLSHSDPQQIVIVKGFGSGVGAMLTALAAGEQLNFLSSAIPVMLLGFVAYGLSIYFYVYAQRYLGAAKTSAYYAISPFIGVLLSMLLLGEWPDARFFVAFAIMAFGAWMVTKDQQT